MYVALLGFILARGDARLPQSASHFRKGDLR